MSQAFGRQRPSKVLPQTEHFQTAILPTSLQDVSPAAYTVPPRGVKGLRGTFGFRRRPGPGAVALLVLALLLVGRILEWLSTLLSNLYLQTIAWVPGNQVAKTYYQSVDFSLVGLLLLGALAAVLVLLAFSLFRRR